jgi:NAD(P)-dependent dehydrogenase (short-subunit alcohol dehydrogenase family)
MRRLVEPSGGGDSLAVQLDVSDKASIAWALASGLERFGSIDVLVNNAGIGLFSVFEATPDAAARQVFETNVFGLFEMVRQILPVFAVQGGGTIVNVSSATGFVPTPLMAIYSASKQAVEAFSESLSHECVSQNVAVKLVVPGYSPGTGFTGNVMAASAVAPTPAAYQPFFDGVIAAVTAPQSGLAGDVEVAEAIHEAASDRSDRLRFPVGADSLLYERMRHETREAEYLAWVREVYRLGSPAGIGDRPTHRDLEPGLPSLQEGVGRV